MGKPGESGFRLNGRRQNRNEAGMAEQGAVRLVGGCVDSPLMVGKEASFPSSSSSASSSLVMMMIVDCGGRMQAGPFRQ